MSIKIINLHHQYKTEFTVNKILNNVDITLQDKCFNVIVGDSGCGKSTLLHCISGLMMPTEGNIEIDNVNLYKLSSKKLIEFRAQNIGFVFQNFYLEKNFSVFENVALPLMNKNLKFAVIHQKTMDALSKVGLAEIAKQKANTLSGGESQRVAIARALVADPKYIFADEPTGNLDNINGKNILSILRELVTQGKTVIMITHNTKQIEATDVVWEVIDGKVEETYKY